MRRTRWHKGALAVSLLGAATVVTDGCRGKEPDCATARNYFEQEVWGGWMSTTCTKCHTPDGIAVQQGARFQLQTSSYPGFIDTNLQMINDIARIDIDGTPEILVKPIGGANHGGGQVLDPNGDEYASLKTLIDKIRNPPTCADTTPTGIDGVSMLSPGDVFRKAAIQLGGRLPTAAEEQAVTTEDALDAALDRLLAEPVFLERVREMFNDSILTDKYDDGYSGCQLLDDADFASVKNACGDGVDYDIRGKASRAIAREPLNFIAYVVANDKPMTEILTGQYAVLNPFGALAYGVSAAAFKDPTNENEYEAVKTAYGNGQPYPHAGVLSTPAFLNRWPTTPTNRSRGRARQTFKSFLGFNVLTLSQRPVDASKITAVDNPTMNAQACNVCHRVIDPVAGGFRGWDEDGDYARHTKDADWHNDMVSPGYDKQQMPPAEYNDSLWWLGTQLAADPRFPIGMTYIAYTGVTGHDPLPYPNPEDGGDYAGKLAAWQAQDQFFRSAAATLVNSNYNFKAVVKAIIKSPYFRGSGAANPSAAELTDIGTSRLLTPEMLDRKIHAVTGAWWADWNNDHHDDRLLRNSQDGYFQLYGGMDSDSVITHFKEPNGTMAAVATRMANEMACALTAWDFTRTQAQRSFFTLVEQDVVPESAGNPVPASIDSIKQNIAKLHRLFLGETLTTDDPEVARTYQLFLDTWHELKTSGATDLGDCAGRTDPTTGKDLDQSVQLNSDPNFTVRSWQAVLGYLMSDYRFSYE